jgi:phage tail-like protein
MDANGTRYYLLLGKQNWADCLADDGQTRLGDLWAPISPPAAPQGPAWNDARAELTLVPHLFQFVAARRDLPPQLDERRGAGHDRYGNWYWIAASRQELLVSSSGSGKTTHFWAAADEADHTAPPRYGDFAPRDVSPPAALTFGGLAVTEDHYLVVGVLEPAGLLIFDLFAGGSPRQILWPAAVPFAPFDMAPRGGGGVWVLDRTHRRCWALDRHFNLVRANQAELTLDPPRQEDFQPVVGDAVRQRAALTFPAGITLDAASPVGALDPIAIELLPDDSLLILDHEPGADFSRIYCLRSGRQGGDVLSTEVMQAMIEDVKAADFRLRGHDIAFVAQREERQDRTLLGLLYVVSSEGNQTFAFELLEQADKLYLEPLPRYMPMRLFGGKGIVAGGDVVYYDFDDRWVPLVEQRRPRYSEESLLYTPITPGQMLFDARIPDCTWHRLFIDACIPPGTEVLVRSRAANELADLRFAQWRPEPQLYKRGGGSERPYPGSSGGYDTWELLFQQAQGRYLQLELRLRGNGQSTPRLRALRAYYPRFSYLSNYLPAVYREDAQSASFTDRLLANFEGLYTSLEDRIAAAQTLFDVRSAPAESLDWLVSWFGVALDPAWEEQRRRLFIRYAMLFFQQRGTLNGLLIALQLALDTCFDERIFTTPPARREYASGIRIVEQFRARRTPGVVLGDPTEPSAVRVSSVGERWWPEQGASMLQQRYRDFLQQQLGEIVPALFGPTPPTSNPALWVQFAQRELGFTPSTDTSDTPLWQSFLARRYRFINALNDSYHLSGEARHTSFSQLLLPSDLPPDGAPLHDWYQFQSIVIPSHRTAHRFTVLLPMTASDPAQQRERLDLARRVIELEKPAHTTYDVKFYWAMFRVGAVRLGYDTLIGQGGRSPELMTPMILGQGHLVESYLAPAAPTPTGRHYLAGDKR